METKNKIDNKRLESIMIEKGLNQKTLSNMVGVTESAISYYLAGIRSPKGAILLNIANALGVSVDYLKGKTNERNSTANKQELSEAINLIARNRENLSDSEKLLLINALLGQ